MFGSDPGKNLSRALIAEMAGTMFLVLAGTAVVASAVARMPITGPPLNSLAVALAFGLVLAGLVPVVGQLSGGHMNPAVTIALAVSGKFKPLLVPLYVIVQVAGACLAAVLLRYCYGRPALKSHWSYLPYWLRWRLASGSNRGCHHLPFGTCNRRSNF
jgi:glycerol uptake facilitator-like aquaporin